jgi:cytochrome P450
MMESENEKRGTVPRLTAEEALHLRSAGCPHQLYRKLNAGPGIYRDPLTGNYVVTRYDLVRTIVADTSVFSSNTGMTIERETPLKAQVGEMYAQRAWPVKHVLLTNDPPEHRIFRALVDKVWSPSRVASLHGYIQDLVERSLERIVQDGEVEFISGFAATFPVIIAIDFLGLPRTDAAQILEWTHAATSIIDPRFDAATELSAHEKVIELLNYIADAGRAVEGGENSFLAALKRVEIDGRQLTEQEFVWLVELLVVGGHDSVTLALGAGMIELIEHPEFADQLRNEPRSIEIFVEELLRTRGPVKALFRRATTATTLEGIEIAEGTIVQLQWSAANHDPAHFDNAEEFLLDRANVKKHLSFGAGRHACIGNQLARAELKIAFEAIVRRMKNFRYSGTDDDVRFRSDYVQQGPTRLCIRFDRA